MAKIHSSLLLIIAVIFLTAAANQSSPRAIVENHADQAESAMHSAAACGQSPSQIVAATLRRPLDAQKFPGNDDWSRAGPIVFCANWKGEQADPRRKTEVRMLWSSQFLYLRFEAHYRDIYIYPETNQRHEKLWLRDVAEVFLQPDINEVKHYKEFEISPNGDWLDLDISPAGGSNLMCDVKTKAIISSEKHVWVAELAIPMKCLAHNFDGDADWRLNLFRIEGNGPDRFYSAWRPTKTGRPNFHVPEVFGTLKFSRD